MRRRDTNAPTTGHVVDGLLGPRIESPADRFIEALEGEPNFKDQLMLAALALKHDPGCIEARLFFAEHVEDAAARRGHLEAAVRHGDYLWNPVVERRGGDLDWWFFPGTRPYMRAIHALGRLHMADGHADQARDCFERLLRMNPYDSQGVRSDLQDLEIGSAPSV